MRLGVGELMEADRSHVQPASRRSEAHPSVRIDAMERTGEETFPRYRITEADPFALGFDPCGLDYVCI